MNPKDVFYSVCLLVVFLFVWQSKQWLVWFPNPFTVFPRQLKTLSKQSHTFSSIDAGPSGNWGAERLLRSNRCGRDREEHQNADQEAQQVELGRLETDLCINVLKCDIVFVVVFCGSNLCPEMIGIIGKTDEFSCNSRKHWGLQLFSWSTIDRVFLQSATIWGALLTICNNASCCNSLFDSRSTSHQPGTSSALSHGQLRPLLRGRSFEEHCSRSSQGLQRELELDLDHCYCGANQPS